MQPSVLAVNATLNVDNAPALIDLIRRNPGKYAFGSIGAGCRISPWRRSRSKAAQLVHVPYPSSPQAMTALIRNDVQMVCLPAISVVPQLGSGALKVLAVSTDDRSALLPDIPTLKEAGLDVEADAWNGLIAPAGISPATAARIGRLVGEAIAADDVRAKLAAQFMAPMPGTPTEFRARIDADLARWAPVIAAAKIKIND
jgi:tripartite-type tricarboxylate transporter receptor subunit TctC